MDIQWPLLIFSVLLGVTSGAFVFLGVGELAGRFKEVRFVGAIVAIVCLVVGGCASALHLGHPERAMHLLGNLGSGLSKELFIVAIMFVVAVIYAILVKRDYPGARRAFGVVGAVVGLVLPFVAGASYMMAARPAWDSVALPLMYLGSGLALGMLLMCGLVLLRGDAECDGKLAIVLALVGVAAMVVTSLAYVAWVAMAPNQADSRSIARLVSGDLAVAFWGLVVVVGLAAPAALTGLAYARSRKQPAASGDGSVAVASQQLAAIAFAALACSAVGAIALRVIMYGVGTSVEQFIYR